MKEEIAEGVEDWCGLKKKLVDVASKVCGYTKDKPRHFEIRWWKKDVDVAVYKKRVIQDLETDSE